MQEVHDFLKKCRTYYLATVEDGRPRVRPFGTIHLFDGRLYIQTGKMKDVSKQLAARPEVEICAFNGEEWLRVRATLVDDPRVEAKQSLLDAYPELQGMYSATDDNTQVLYLKDAVGVFSSFTAPSRMVEF